MNWISEKDAAEKLGFKSLLRFRRNVKERKIPLAYRSTNGRKFQYTDESIKKYQNKTATI